MVGIVLAIPCGVRDGGIWEFFMPELTEGAHYKYSVLSRAGFEQLKSDPYGFFAEVPRRPRRSCGGFSNYKWADAEWMELAANTSGCARPFRFTRCISNRGCAGRKTSGSRYRELASVLVEYVKRMGYTHLELMPVMEHPFPVRGVIR